MKILKLTAIVITRDPADPKAKPHAASYKFDNRPNAIKNFERFVAKNFPGADWINYYDRSTEKFWYRKYLKT